MSMQALSVRDVQEVIALDDALARRFLGAEGEVVVTPAGLVVGTLRRTDSPEQAALIHKVDMLSDNAIIELAALLHLGRGTFTDHDAAVRTASILGAAHCRAQVRDNAGALAHDLREGLADLGTRAVA